jgi:HEAT repeat protein
MSKAAFEKKLAAIEALRREGAGAAEPLRKALRERNNYVVAKAAGVAEFLELRELVPDLLVAFERFFQKAVETDPQCWAKNALAKALKNLEYAEAEPFLRGLAHQQWEPVWGGREDTATTLRGACLHALAGCGLPSFDLLSHLGGALADGAKVVRMEAARAIAAAGVVDGALLLRLKARVGDKEPEVTGQCLSALIGMELRGSVPFVAGFLGDDDLDVRMEAAAALSESKDGAAIAGLERYWGTLRETGDRRAVLKLLAFSPAREAGALLQKIGADESDGLAGEAKELWRGSRHAASS